MHSSDLMAKMSITDFADFQEKKVASIGESKIASNCSKLTCLTRVISQTLSRSQGSICNIQFKLKHQDGSKNDYQMDKKGRSYNIFMRAYLILWHFGLAMKL